METNVSGVISIHGVCCYCTHIMEIDIEEVSSSELVV